MTQLPLILNVTHYFCAAPTCGVPAVWRVGYPDGSFWTLCEAHQRMLERAFPDVGTRTRALLPDEAPGPGLRSFYSKGGKLIGGVVVGVRHA